MGADSNIEWTTHTFNPWRGCTKVSAGCANCYAETLSGRNPKVLGEWGPAGTRVVASEAKWREPLAWDRAAKAAGERHRVFCASLADVFEDWRGLMSGSDGAALHACAECGAWRTMEDMCHGPNAHMALTIDDVRARLLELIHRTPNLDWLLLTKRPAGVLPTLERMAKPCGDGAALAQQWVYGAVMPNIWMGVSVENQQAADERIPLLLEIPAAVRFLSCEPLLGPVEFSNVTRRSDAARVLGRRALEGVHWVICGGESGPHARPMHPDWARSLRDQCRAAGVRFFFKQWGEWAADENGDRAVLTDGRNVSNVEPNGTNGDGAVRIARVGKKAAGRMLDGRTWDDFPGVA